MEKELTDDEVIRRWKELICKPAQDAEEREMEDGPDWDNYIWEGVWMGFVIGLGRPDLATYNAYINLGFPWEGAA